MFPISNQIHQDETSHRINRHVPSRAISITFHYVESAFVGSARVMTITKCGHVVIWEGSSYKKELLKTVRVTNESLVSIRSIDSFIVIADTGGHIRFFDEELKIVFWCPSFDRIDSIKTISFNLEPRRAEDDESEDVKNSKVSVRNFIVRKLFNFFFWIRFHFLSLAHTKSCDSLEFPSFILKIPPTQRPEMRFIPSTSLR